MAVLVVACGRYRELGPGFEVDNAREAGLAAVRELERLGVGAELFEGKVTEKRLERAIRGVAKAARRGERAGLVWIGQRIGGALVVENGAFRKGVKPMRTFSGGRTTRLGPGVPVVDVGFEWGEDTPGPRGEPRDWKRWLERWKRRDPTGRPRIDVEKLKAQLRWKFARPQIDPEHDCIWMKVGSEFVVAGEELGTTALAELFNPLTNQLLGLLEIEPLADGTTRELWRFAAGTWPAGTFHASKLLSAPGNQGRWANTSLANALAWPVLMDLQWKGFMAASSQVSIPTAFRLAPASGNELPVYAATIPEGPFGRQVIGWYSASANGISFGTTNRIVAVHVTNVPTQLHEAKG